VLTIKKKWIKRIAVIIASLLIIFIVAVYFVMDYATNKILRAISVDDLIPNQHEIILPSQTPDATVTPSLSPNPGTPTPDNTSPSKTQETTKAASPSSTPYVASISIDKAKNAKKNISFNDQTKISLILLNKLSSSDISLFSKMTSGGLTIPEKIEAKKIILQKLTEEEYSELIQIAAKLGLSQGESYQESIKSIPTK
jgi:hypothetical protein